MAHNRSLYIASSTAPTSEKSLEKISHDTKVLHQEVDAPHNSFEFSHEEIFESPRYESQSSFRVESDADKVVITLQQLSFGAAIFLCASFAIFLAGYGMGRYKVVHGDNHHSTVSIATVWELLVRLDKAQPTMHLQDNEYARYATKEEAEAHADALIQRGLLVSVVERRSSSSRGTQSSWFQIVDKQSRLKVS